MFEETDKKRELVDNSKTPPALVYHFDYEIYSSLLLYKHCIDTDVDIEGGLH
jgi:hypothetical protein